MDKNEAVPNLMRHGKETVSLLQGQPWGVHLFSPSFLSLLFFSSLCCFTAEVFRVANYSYAFGSY